MMNICSLSNIKYQIDNKIILDKVNFDFEKNKFYTIVGASGAGKTTLLRIIAGLEKPSAGFVNLKTKSSISYSPQDNSFFPWLTCLENIRICNRNTAIGLDEIRQELEQVGLSQYADKYPNALSGGMLQKLSVVRSFINATELILMDEPFANIDHFDRIEQRRIVKVKREESKSTVILVTHDFSEALKISDEVLFFSRKNKGIIESIKVKSLVDQDRNDIIYQQLYSHLLDLSRREYD